ncbi:MAG: glycosyltransferase family 4 protein [Cytophagales bacterium]|nr:glycosyltransferase family 4 protein [Cytophagales bacterium]
MRNSIVHIIDELTPGGAEKILVLAANGFMRLNYQVTVVTIIRPGELVSLLDSGVRHICLNRKTHWDLRALFQLRGIIHSNDLTHVHLKHTLKYIFLSYVVRPFRSRVLLHDHSGDVLVNRRNVYPWIMRWWVKRMYYLGVTRELTDWAIKVYKINRKRAFTLQNVVEPGLANYTPPEFNQGSTLRFVVVSNFRPIKNINFAIGLINYLRTFRNLDATLTIFGQPIDTTYFHQILALIKEFKLESAISIVTNETDVLPRLKDFDLGLHCSLAETGPLSLLEFMQAGLPFLGIQRGHVAEDVLDFRAELIINNYDFSHWADRIQIIVPHRNTLSTDLQKFVNYNYKSEDYIAKLDKIYSGIIYEKIK